MNENEQQLMSRYQITSESKVVFHYDGHRYDRLADAVSYAKKHQSTADDSDQRPEPEAQA